MSSARAYLWPAGKRANLHVEMHAHATRLLFEGSRAVGVEYVRKGARLRARAAGEVILSAGAINSPQLLQLSGIGPASVLRAAGVDVRLGGDLGIRSADPFEHPRIRPNYLATEHDIQEMLEGVEFLRRLAATPSLSAIIEGELAPGAEVRTRDELLDDIRQRASTVFHPVGTCVMGPEPGSAVVDHRLRLHGLQRLRVVDASIFPSLISGNTNAPTIMAGEKGADLILADAR